KEKIDHFTIAFEEKTLDIRINVGDYLERCAYEIIRYLSETSNEEILVRSYQNEKYVQVSIKGKKSKPIDRDVCRTLEGKITEAWESKGFYIGISLSSVIIQRFGGLIRIIPGKTTGNEFLLFIPKGLTS
ncbi:MAG: hypothetical protein ACFFD4_36725, partial [Candidatus Odinarchaeota archaeon]